jgi:hypothetical protein
MLPTADAVLAHAQTVVIGNNDPEFAQVQTKLRTDQSLVDFVRITRQGSANAQRQLILS